MLLPALKLRGEYEEGTIQIDMHSPSRFDGFHQPTAHVAEGTRIPTESPATRIQRESDHAYFGQRTRRNAIQNGCYTPKLCSKCAKSCQGALGPMNRVICSMKTRKTLPQIVAR